MRACVRGSSCAGGCPVSGRTAVDSLLSSSRSLVPPSSHRSMPVLSSHAQNAPQVVSLAALCARPRSPVASRLPPPLPRLGHRSTSTSRVTAFVLELCVLYAVCCMLYAVCCIRICCMLYAVFEYVVCCMLYALYVVIMHDC